MKGTSAFVRFLYGNCLGRCILKMVQKLHIDRFIVWYLKSPLSRPLIAQYARRHGIPMEGYTQKSFRTFREFFARTRPIELIDITPEHLISPCDGWLSAYTIYEDSSFNIKSSHYCLNDLLKDSELSQSLQGGTCLIFRLSVSDYHHYCYIDDGYQCENHFIPGTLHSVQPIACERFPVYTLNRRLWTLLLTEHFGPVVQTEIGALIVGGIYNESEKTRFCKGTEMGHFELAGSTIVLLFQKDRIELLREVEEQLNYFGEIQVKQGAWIGNQTINEKIKEYYHD